MHVPADPADVGSSDEPDLSWLPPGVRRYDQPVRDNLGPGSAGKAGRIDLRLEDIRGTTRIAKQFQRAPLHLFQPVYLDPARPGMAFVYLQQSGDGLVQGDRYLIDIECGASSAVHITTQTPTKVFRARDNYVSQQTSITAHQDSVVEYMPDPIVPCAGSRLFQITRLTVHPRATVITGETLLPGRVAHHERHAYDVFWSRVDARRHSGERLFIDLIRLSPAQAPVNSLAALGSYDVVATLFVLSEPSIQADLIELLRQRLATHAEVLSGVSELPNRAGVSVRMLGVTATAVAAAHRDAWDAARLVTIGSSAPDLRKY